MKKKNKAARTVNAALGLIVIIAVILASPLFGYGRWFSTEEDWGPSAFSAGSGTAAGLSAAATPRPTARPTPTPVVLPTAPPAPTPTPVPTRAPAAITAAPQQNWPQDDYYQDEYQQDDYQPEPEPDYSYDSGYQEETPAEESAQDTGATPATEQETGGVEIGGDPGGGDTGGDTGGGDTGVDLGGVGDTAAAEEAAPSQDRSEGEAFFIE